VVSLFSFCLVGSIQVAGALGVALVAGYTTNDQQVYGPALKRIARDTLAGTHLVWKDAYSNPVYNFFDRRSRAWHWPNGTPVFDQRASLGSLEINPLDQIPTISGSFLQSGRHTAIYAYDSAVAQGRFTSVENQTRNELQWNLTTFSNDGRHQFAALAHDSIMYHRNGSPTYLGQAGNFPTHNIAGSQANSHLAIFWTRTKLPDMGDLYLRRSTNTGYGWRSPIVPSRTIPDDWQHTFLGAYGEYDRQGDLHIVANVYNGTNCFASALWHYCEANTPNWSLIYRCMENRDATVFAPKTGGVPVFHICVHLCSSVVSTGSLPTEALIAGRPTIAENPRTGDFFVVWEQFDPLNSEPETGILRADLWAARSHDQGRTWASPLRLTEPDQTSKRYPGLARIVDDTLHIQYLCDSIAGSASQGQGRATQNPIVYLRVPAVLIPSAVSEDRPCASNGAPRLSITPSHGGAIIEWTLSGSPASLRVLDISGRLVRDWRLAPGSRRRVWDGSNQLGAHVPGGVYLVILQTSQFVVSGSLLVVRATNY
jgi:hypothetical protein